MSQIRDEEDKPIADAVLHILNGPTLCKKGFHAFS